METICLWKKIQHLIALSYENKKMYEIPVLPFQNFLELSTSRTRRSSVNSCECKR